jgi:hypothetical protein
VKIIAEYGHERKSIQKVITSIMWHMRGSISRDEAWSLCHEEREIISKFIEERIKVVEKTGLPMI